MVVGPGRVVGERLAEHPDVAKISFTGSTEVGARVVRGAAATVARACLWSSAASRPAWSSRTLDETAAGSAYLPRSLADCRDRTAARVRESLVQQSVYDAFVAQLIEATGSVKVGDPEDGDTQMGPLLPEGAPRHGVVLRRGDAAIVRGEGSRRPGLRVPVHHRRGEQRGPRRARRCSVRELAIIPFEDEADAVRIANDTPYGLSGSVWTRDGARALRVVRGIDSGVLSVNANTSVRVATPFGVQSPDSGASWVCRRWTVTQRSRTCSCRDGELMGRPMERCGG